MKKALLAMTSFLVLTTSCKEQQEKQQESKEKAHVASGYPIEPINIRNVKVHDDFWLPIIQRVQEKTIEYAIEKCREEGRFDNFLIAGGEMEGSVKGAMPFDDTDVYKIIEGASNSLISAPNPELEKLLDSLVYIIKVGQETDGYLTTWRTIDPAKPPASWVKVDRGERWESLDMSHELYNAGHLFEAAVVHYKATGKRNFLDIAIKNADLMVRTFGEGEGKVAAVPGHQIIETGLIKLYQTTGKKDYFDLAKYFLDHRGKPEHHELFGDYSQDHVPVTDQDEVVGHAVRAVYMYAGMTDIAAIEKDTAYLKAVNALWENMVNKKMYITGGIGAKHEGEAFGENYELPNLTAYNETCAAIGDVYWNHRLHNLTGDVKYFDVIERTLYNGLISGLSLDGQKFFYPNALESDGVYKFNQGACTRKDWFDCSCCPTNVIRFLPAMPGLIYSKTDDTVFVNLYATNDATVDLKAQTVKLSQETSYPWNGKVKLSIDPKEEKGNFAMKLRIPGWARNEVLPGNLYQYGTTTTETNKISLNGEELDVQAEDGYFTISREWTKGDVLELEFPMSVREVIANPKVEEDKGKMSLEYGPIVYAVEEIDNKGKFDDIQLSANEEFKVEMQPDLLKGVNTISNEKLTAIPYYAWSNRGIGKMKVWLPAKAEGNTDWD
ncbi:glycoside hydrolase family 127 protein [Flagellimonas halotolerans]|uniref:Glycoside hydrolase family 127 protein n=1 Tax=Flagellimonas halotolerans TaxID=3112164 RepID=A0ABU6IQ76_9FLAO|nr:MULTISPECIES: glycoside hydrolase family 127 protein [unclassified Allomuricauda]MEC3965313.1 glycoside hydrolase family 127 protein [Muricauda sp. SYSU M86414]MEC4265179.1 glycoside hydrolase family 127 protein [Muricauda sp. SYSU M84420]